MAVIQQNNDPYEELALAICMCAIEDYKCDVSTSGSSRKAIESQMKKEPMSVLWEYFMKDQSFEDIKHLLDNG